ncbi:hypothetical protein N0V82_004391 [Gnomoniopsis sp. IMI 355080]|nr:hypothetical protein N0V82_004391 [Gnomoniopsis sp. IMI 355080]
MPNSGSDLTEALSLPKDDGDLRSYLVEFIDQPQIAERPIDKEARTVYVGSEVSNTSFLVRQRFGSKATPGVSHYAANRVARRYTCHEPDRLPIEAFQLPTKSVVDALLDAYFTHVNPIFPVVDQNLFMEQYRARDSSNPPSLLLLHAMLVAGAHVLYRKPERDVTKSQFFCRAKTLFDARFERNRDTVVQAALLLTWHADGVEDVLANAWFWVGVAARTAMGLGMHRDADQSTLVPHNKRMWRRIWWLLFQCDVMVSLQYGRPPAIRLDESDVKHLQPSDFDDCGPNVQIENFIHQTDLCIILSHGIGRRLSLSSPNPSANLEHLQRMDKELANWSLQHPPSEVRPSYAQAHVASSMSQVIYNAALILIHRRRPDEREMQDAYVNRRDDESICWTAAFAIQQIFQELCEYDRIQSVWVFGVNCLFTAMVQLSVQVKAPNPVVAISALKQYESTLSSMRRLSEYWPHSESILHFFEKFVSSPHNGIGHEDPKNDEEPHPSMKASGRNLEDYELSSGGEFESRQYSRNYQSISRYHRGLHHSSEDFGDLRTATIETVDNVLQAWQDWQDWQDWQNLPELSDELLLTFQELD